MAWLSARDRLSTLDRIAKWSQGIDTTCVLCKGGLESRNHLFFECSYTGQVWEHIAKGILCNSFTNSWSEIMEILTDLTSDNKSMFCIRYAFQAVLYAVWRERNKLRHGYKLLPLPVLKRMIDKGIRNRIILISKQGVKGMEGLMQYWFSTRI